LKALRNRGILLAIVSKNDEYLAIEALTKHPEMVLRTSDFVAMRINWKDKAANIVEICAELNLGLQSVVFIDDNPVERARIREALTEVFVPDWPDDKTSYASTLWELDCFDSAYVTAEDLSRNEIYTTEKHRQILKQTVGSPEEWLLSLGTEVNVEELNPTNRARAVQLLNKTNQMNLTTRRLSEQELKAWLQAANRRFWVFRVKDKFGDSGLTGLLSLEIDSGVAHIVDFVLSCRVMGRNVERSMVAFAAKCCTGLGLQELRANFVPTPKNKPCHQFWVTSGFSCDDTRSRFNWQLAEPYAFPAGISFRELGGSPGYRAAVFAGPQLYDTHQY
jgi:FkbH-like protein